VAADLRRHLILINNDRATSFIQQRPRRIHAARDCIVHLPYADQKHTEPNLRTDPGSKGACVGASSRDIRLKTRVTIAAEQVLAN
jgi:hypothetical protein